MGTLALLYSLKQICLPVAIFTYPYLQAGVLKKTRTELIRRQSTSYL